MAGLMLSFNKIPKVKVKKGGQKKFKKSKGSGNIRRAIKREKSVSVFVCDCLQRTTILFIKGKLVDSNMDSSIKSTPNPEKRGKDEAINTPKEYKGLENLGTSAKLQPINYCSRDECLTKHVSLNPPLFDPYYLNSSLLNVCRFQASTRSKMVFWFIEESSNQFLPRTVCSKAIFLLDWFLMREIEIGINKLQQLGIACLGLAWKMNQSGVGIIPVDENNFSKKSIVELEKMVLTSLRYMISGPTYISLALEMLYCWDMFAEKTISGLPIYLKNINDDEFNDMSALLRIDEFFNIIDLCSSVLEFLDYRPQDIIFNILFFFVRIYKFWPNLPPFPDADLIMIFQQFSEQIPREGLTPIRHMMVCEKLQNKVSFIYDVYCKEKQLQSEKNPHYNECAYLRNFYFEFSMKEAKEINLDDNYERVKKRKIARKARKPMNLLETIANIQVNKPYYNRVARSLLKNLQTVRN